MFQFVVAWSFVWGAKPRKAPRGDGTVCIYLVFDFFGQTQRGALNVKHT